jgi:putative toxin-antitoxin system antitoxin component (TIGR02293 family)
MKTAKKPAKNRGNGPKAFPWAGIIASHVHGAKTKEAEALRATPAVNQAVQRGLPFDELEALRAALDLPLDKLAPKLGMSLATLHRRKQEGRLTQAESDRLMRYARLMRQAMELFRDETAAREWLKRPAFGLGGAVPLDYADTEMGAREVEDLLGRIAYGVYS